MTDLLIGGFVVFLMVTAVLVYRSWKDFDEHGH